MYTYKIAKILYDLKPTQKLTNYEAFYRRTEWIKTTVMFCTHTMPKEIRLKVMKMLVENYPWEEIETLIESVLQASSTLGNAHEFLLEDENFKWTGKRLEQRN